MSPSALEYDGRYEVFRDSELFAVVAVLEYFMESGCLDPALSGVVSAWKQACVVSGPGTIDFDFTELRSDLRLAETVRAALAWAESESQRRWSANVPADVLNRYDPEVIEFGGFPTAKLVSAFQRVRRVIGDAGDA